MYKMYTHLYIYMEPVVLDPWIVTPRQSAGKRKPGFQYIIYIYIYIKLLYCCFLGQHQ